MLAGAIWSPLPACSVLLAAFAALPALPAAAPCHRLPPARTSPPPAQCRVAWEYLRTAEETMARLEEADFPLAIWHSENDTMCDCDGSKQLYLRARSADKSLRLVNHMWHVRVREEGSDEVGWGGSGATGEVGGWPLPYRIVLA